MTIFTIVIFIFLTITAYGARVIEKESFKGILISISVGFAFVLSNFYTSIVITSIKGLSTGDIAIFIIFIIAVIILLTTNFYGIARLQVAFKYVDASKAIPLNLAPQQIVPIFAYILVFALIPGPLPIILIVSGIIVILVSGYLLVKRQAELEAEYEAMK